MHRRRILVLVAIGVLGYTGLAARAVQLQALDSEWLGSRAARQHESTVTLAPMRGELRDRHGTLLAMSATVDSIAASPRKIENHKRVAARLARALGAPSRDVRARLRPNRGFTWIKRWVTPDQAERVRKLNLTGVHVHEERKRFYPNRELAAPYLGFAGRDGEGLSGIELAYDGALHGTEESFPALRDARGKKLPGVGATPDPRGATLVLTLDAKLQHFAEAALERALERTGARHGTLIALDPNNGDLLAVAEAPGFDPNRYWEADPALHRARALVDTFEPGSTLKPFSIAIALEAGKVRPNDRFDCENGSWRVADRRIRDWKPYGVLTVRDVIRLSSNIGTAKVANKTGSRELVRGLRGFGFGEPTGSGFPGEENGLVRDIREKQVVERANLSFGQGISITALQLASGGAVLANGGYRIQPRIALRLEQGEVRVKFPGSPRERVISERTAHTVREMMEAVVADGTGGGASVPRQTVAGKTGTAQKVINGRYSNDLFVASFLGMMPASNPRIVVVVVLDEPRRGTHTGGMAAAPVFGEVGRFAAEQMGLPASRRGS